VSTEDQKKTKKMKLFFIRMKDISKQETGITKYVMIYLLITPFTRAVLFFTTLLPWTPWHFSLSEKSQHLNYL